MGKITRVTVGVVVLLAGALPVVGQAIINGRQLYPLIDQQVITVTIASGSALSDVAAIPDGYRLCGLEMPSALVREGVTRATIQDDIIAAQKLAPKAQ